jgi:hypothetical protein
LIRRHGSPVTDTAEGREERVEHSPGGGTGEPGDEPDAARIALADGRIEHRKRHERPFRREKTNTRLCLVS